MEEFIMAVPVDVDPLMMRIHYSTNCSFGCSNCCKYCFQLYKALEIGKIKTPNEWSKMYNIPYKKVRVDGLLEMGIRHDLTPVNVDQYIKAVNDYLKLKNNILITSKPNYKVIIKFLENVAETDYKHLVWRLSITTMDNKIRKDWEPGASDYDDRFKALELLHEIGFEIHLNIEPFLDADPWTIVEHCNPLVNGKIQIGSLILNTVLIRNEVRQLPAYRFNANEIYTKCKSISDKVQFRNSITNPINHTHLCNCGQYKIRVLRSIFK
jgi:hypothetical protein